jgi:hypothetical protein
MSHRGQADAGYLMLDAGYSNKKTRREIGHEGSKTRRKLDAAFADCTEKYSHKKAQKTSDFVPI